ncbi:unnamed protein product [Blepharisma stoltei]|uniref:Uncharacterized protein n=1 Tax=Blepharisma stoltei TaxID=1481888 RepID=A0AAU9JUW5_9CILI|nr:unnamed protein product [Blepharisma stoltei]
MSTFEYSFTAFDDFPGHRNNSSKRALEDIVEPFSSAGVKIVHRNIIKASVLDTSIIIRNIYSSLRDRALTFPERKQVVIHLAEDTNIENCEIIVGAQNIVNTIHDDKGHALQNSPINQLLGRSHILNSQLIPMLSELPVSQTNLCGTSIENYLYYLSLTESYNCGIYSLLMCLPPNNPDSADLLMELCVKINDLIPS